MCLILQIETATTACSVALAINGEVLAFKEVNERNIHAEVITMFIEEVVSSARMTYDQIDAIAVSSGPGSYTGLRIGVSTAKGLCFALDKPLIAIETLEGMANGVMSIINNTTNPDMLLCPMIDARRMEVFTAVYNKEGLKIKPVSAEIIAGDSFADLLKQHQILFFGDGAEKCRPVLSASANAFFLPGFANSAIHFTQKTLKKFNNDEFENVAYFEPRYLKDFIAGKKSL